MCCRHLLQTESEINNQGFELWKSEEEDSDYRLIASYHDDGALQGYGNTPVRHVYNFTDPYVTSGQTYSYQLTDVDITGVTTIHDPISITVNASDTSGDPEQFSGIPTKFNLYQNFPNPFNPRTIINYELRITTEVKLSIYNLLGQKVVILVSEKQEAGRYQVEWDASGFASGVYYYIFDAGEFHDVKKMILLQ